MTELQKLKIEIRLAKLAARPKDNDSIRAKLMRKLRKNNK